MERYTVQREGVWTLEAGEAALPKALERLARCENLLAGLEQEQAVLSEKLESLKLQGKQKTVQFRELMARKLVNQQLRLRLAEYGL